MTNDTGFSTGRARDTGGGDGRRTTDGEAGMTAMNPLCHCLEPAVYFSGGEWFCRKHLPKVISVFNEPVRPEVWASATDFVALQNRVAQLERIVAEWTGGR